MGLFDKFRKKAEIIAPVNGKLTDIKTISDPTFSQEMLGKSTAIYPEEDMADVAAPISGTLSAFFPTGHAFGITGNNGLEVLVHIGIDTVEANGDGFRIGKYRQGDKVKAGDVIVTADFKKLKEKYDVPVIIVITNDAGNHLAFIPEKHVIQGESVTQ